MDSADAKYPRVKEPADVPLSSATMQTKGIYPPPKKKAN